MRETVLLPVMDQKDCNGMELICSKSQQSLRWAMMMPLPLSKYVHALSNCMVDAHT